MRLPELATMSPTREAETDTTGPGGHGTRQEKAVPALSGHGMLGCGLPRRQTFAAAELSRNSTGNRGRIARKRGSCGSLHSLGFSSLSLGRDGDRLSIAASRSRQDRGEMPPDSSDAAAAVR